MTEFTILLSAQDTELLFNLKQQQGKDEMTGNDFAEYLLTRELHRLEREGQKQCK